MSEEPQDREAPTGAQPTLDGLVGQISDPSLRDSIARGLADLREGMRFGIDYSRHLPEVARLPHYRVSKGETVMARDERDRSWYRVIAFTDSTRKRVRLAPLLADGTPRPGAAETVESVSALVVIRRFGEAIYPGLLSARPVVVGPGAEKRERQSDPTHVAIGGDNLHVLQALTSVYVDASGQGTIDCIYIDPPYNTGSESWIYNDKYVSKGDRDSSSKWVGFMARRLQIAQTLLSNSGFILVSIDDNEQHRLRLLLDRVFGPKNFVATFAWRSEGNLDNQAKVKVNHEYVHMYAKNLDSMILSGIKDPNISEDSKLYTEVIRNSVVKNGTKNPPSTISIPAGFPANFEHGVINARTNKWPHYDHDLVVDGGVVTSPANAYTGWANANLLRTFINSEFSDVLDTKGQLTRFELTHTGAIENVKVRRGDQHHILTSLHNLGTTEKAGNHLRDMGVTFPFPKPLGLVSYLVSLAPTDALILDFFAGSGTTMEAVLRLNAGDGGGRQCISVTNNEVGAKKAAELLLAGSLPGDSEWEKWGVTQDVARPRIETVVSGKRRDGTEYRAHDSTVGLAARVAFFDLVHLDPTRVEHRQEFAAISPLLWMRAGAVGTLIDRIDEELGFTVNETYGVLFDLAYRREFAIKVEQCQPKVRFIVSDSDTDFALAAGMLPGGAHPDTTVQLYSEYLTNFQTNMAQRR